MALKMVSTDRAPEAVGPYSQAVRAGNLLFCSGQIPIDPSTGELKLFDGDAAKQARLVMENIRALLSAETLSFDHVIKTTIYLSNMEDFAKVNEVYTSFFKEHLPARACVEVGRLPKDAAVEIEAIAWAK
jgi:2-iminobutanoate/2-iminopropanoate deaminase